MRFPKIFIRADQTSESNKTAHTTKKSDIKKSKAPKAKLEKSKVSAEDFAKQLVELEKKQNPLNILREQSWQLV